MTQSRVSTASVVTDRPARYAKQLVSHMTRRAEGEWSEQTGTGWLRFAAGQARLEAADGVLQLRVEGEDLDRLEDVVGRHLVRFGARDELVASWSRDDGTPGTTQRNDSDE